MPYSIEHYKKMYERSLFKLTKEMKNDSLMEKHHLLSIKELIIFYKKLSQRTFLGIKSSSVHHVKESDDIITLIDAALLKENITSQLYTSTLLDIHLLITKIVNKRGFNLEGDFANLHEALKVCALGYDFYQTNSYQTVTKKATINAPITKALSPSDGSDSYNSQGFFKTMIAAEIMTHTIIDHGHSHSL